MQKFSIKYWQTASKNTLEKLFIMIKEASSQRGRAGSTYENLSMLSIISINCRKKTHMIISLDAEKIFDKIQHPIMKKVLERLGIKCSFLNIIKSNTQQADS